MSLNTVNTADDGSSLRLRTKIAVTAVVAAVLAVLFAPVVVYSVGYLTLEAVGVDLGFSHVVLGATVVGGAAPVFRAGVHSLWA